MPSGSTLNGMWCFVRALGAVVVVVYFGAKFPLLYTVRDEFYLNPFWYRFGYTLGATAIVRWQYYFAWFLAGEPGFVAASYGYSAGKCCCCR